MQKALLLISLLLFSAGMLFAAGQQEAEGPDVVKVLTWENMDPSYSVLGEQPVIEYIEEELDIDVQFQLFAHADRDTAISLVIAAGGEMPDLFPFAPEPGGVLEEKGVIIAWSDLMEAGKMPLTAAKLNLPKWAGVKKQITDSDTGKIYGMPMLAWRKLSIWADLIRGDWLEALGLEVPTTVEEYRDVLRAFKTQDPNGNGIADENGWQCHLEGVRFLQMWKRMFGLPSPDYSLSSFDGGPYWSIVDSEEVVFAPVNERYKAMLEYLNSLWAEGLINQEQFNMTSPKAQTGMSDNTLGSFPHWPGAIPNYTELVRQIEPNAFYIPIPYPIDTRFVKPEERKIAFQGPVAQTWYLAKNGANTEAAVRLIDYVFGNEDVPFLLEFGVEGIHHEIGDDGFPVYIGKWAEMTEYSRMSALGTQVGRLPVENRAFTIAKKVDTDPIFTEYKKFLSQVEEYMKPATFWARDMAQREAINEVMAAVKDYVDESTMKFIIGTKPFSEWDKYIATVEKEAGTKIDAALEVLQAFFDAQIKDSY